MPAGWALAASTVLIAAGLAAYYAVRATSWAVMTDELQVVRLAESIAGRLSPVPYIHGEYYGALSQLYPLMLAPFFGTLSAPAAETAAHALNAVLLPSAAWPAFLLARSVTGSRAAAAAAAVLTAFTPWLVLTSTLLTENAAYPAFVWAIYLCHRTLAAPSARNDALALAGLMLAFFARTQLLVLAVALPLVLVVHAGPRRAVRSHPLLAGVYTVSFVVAAALFWLGSLGAVVGNYAAPFSGDLLPDGLWASAASHLVHVVVGCSVLPFVLAAAWVVLTLVRGGSTSAHAFAGLFAVVVPLLTVEVASFDLRFTPDGFNQDRYLFYLAPLFAVGAAAALVSAGAFLRLAACSAAVFGVFAWFVLQFAAYDDERVIFWAAPAAAVHTALPGDGLLVLSAVLLLGGALVLLRRMPRLALPVVSALVAALGVAQVVYVYERYADPAMTRPPKLALARDWIDRAVPGNQSVALVPAPRDTGDYWWEAELWNKQADRVLRVNGGPTFSPFPTDDVTVDFEHGLLRGSQPSDFLLLSAGERRFDPVEVGRLVDDRSLKLVQVDRPYRLDWATRGVTPDGWTVAGSPATLRFYANGGRELRRIEVVLAASSRAARPLHFRLRAAGREQGGWVDPGGARPPVRFNLCVPARGFVDLTLQTPGAVRIPDGRLVGLQLDRISSTPAGACPPGQVSSR
ncbi:MAG TPA: glycosyltransferase family 39 protein [Gaiellaceae bacterium]|nr:glycosyltransferase family 39 protein [Gaiellaceae bacterium]